MNLGPNLNLLCAAREGDIEGMRAHIAAGADVRIDLHGKTALHIAAWAGHTSSVELLIELGAPVDARDSHGHTAIHNASCRGHAGCTAALLAAGADANAAAFGSTTLHSVCRGFGGIFWPTAAVCAKLLIQAGADVNARDDNEFTPFYWALRFGRRTLAKILLRAGALEHQTCQTSGATKVLIGGVEAAGGWKPYAAKHKRVLAGLVVKCAKRPFPLDAAGLVVAFYCPEGGY